MYKMRVVNGIVVEKSVGCSLGEGEYEVTSAQFYQAQLPCEGNFEQGSFVLGEPVGFDQLPRTIGVLSRPSQEEMAQEGRMRRNSLLSDTDYTQMADSPLTEDCRMSFAVYRQELRDITKQEGWPEEISWPNLPEIVTVGEENG